VVSLDEGLQSTLEYFKEQLKFWNPRFYHVGRK
jgi:hypothetical protein